LWRAFGGAIGVFATWDRGNWHGAYQIFPMRWKPELNPETEDFEHASIMHPVKDILHPIRSKRRSIREALKGRISEKKSSG